jgi:hypothetical protein
MGASERNESNHPFRIRKRPYLLEDLRALGATAAREARPIDRAGFIHNRGDSTFRRGESDWTDERPLAIGFAYVEVERGGLVCHAASS